MLKIFIWVFIIIILVLLTQYIRFINVAKYFNGQKELSFSGFEKYGVYIKDDRSFFVLKNGYFPFNGTYEVLEDRSIKKQ